MDNDANEEQDAVVLVTKHGWLGSWYAKRVCMARPNPLYYGLYKAWILSDSALSIGVENDAIEDKNAWATW